MVRAGLELDSERRGICQAGQVVQALDERECADGTLRVQIDRGWVSKTTKGGAAILVETEVKDGGAENAPSEPGKEPRARRAEGCGEGEDPRGVAGDDPRGVAGGDSELYILPPYILYQALGRIDVRMEASTDAGVVSELEEGDPAEVQGEQAGPGGRWYNDPFVRTGL